MVQWSFKSINHWQKSLLRSTADQMLLSLSCKVSEQLKVRCKRMFPKRRLFQSNAPEASSGSTNNGRWISERRDSDNDRTTVAPIVVTAAAAAVGENVERTQQPPKDCDSMLLVLQAMMELFQALCHFRTTCQFLLRGLTAPCQWLRDTMPIWSWHESVVRCQQGRLLLALGTKRKHFSAITSTHGSSSDGWPTGRC